MNGWMSGGEENEADLLLFQYLEGELTPRQAKALEARLATDAELRTQLEYWQETFVKQDFYNTTSLEQSLLRELAKGIYASAAFYVFLLVTFVALLYPLPVAKERDTAIPRLNPVMIQMDATPAKVPINKPSQQISPVARLHSYRSISGQISPLADEQRVWLVDEIHPVEQIQTLTGTNSDRIGIIPPARVRKVPLPRVASGKTLSRKERRQLVRMKEKARQRRQANEFMKGNVPYVVPLDLKNF